jgi:hypothetical protein
LFDTFEDATTAITRVARMTGPIASHGWTTRGEVLAEIRTTTERLLDGDERDEGTPEQVRLMTRNLFDASRLYREVMGSLDDIEEGGPALTSALENYDRVVAEGQERLAALDADGDAVSVLLDEITELAWFINLWIMFEGAKVGIVTATDEDDDEVSEQAAGM